MRTAIAAIILMALWLLMSGVYETLTIGFGVASVALVIFVTKRMDKVDGDRVEIRLRPVAFLMYLMWLLVEIAKANWAVTKLILAPRMQLRQHMFFVPYRQ
ncbi:MAG: multicomponent Na+:H+ antiporter subunit E, partial [Paracoccaceae bacterium]